MDWLSNPVNEMTVNEMRIRLLKIIKEISVERGEFVLASGKTSNYYIDCRQTTLNPEGAFLVGRLFLKMIMDSNKEIEAVGGPTMGADPIVTAVSIESYRCGRPMPAFIVRKSSKGHGLNQWIEGRKNIRDGARVAILEDVVTTGGSVLNAIKKAEDGLLRVELVLAMIDRGGGEKIREAGYEFHSIFTSNDILC